MQEQLSEKWFAIVNPTSGNGRGLADWPLISKLLRDSGIVPDYAFTEHKYHAIELAVTALSQGYRRILAIGGDGTVHEIVNGLFIQQSVPTTDVVLGVIATGTGNDWVRMFGIESKYPKAVRAIADGHSILQDIGKVSYHKATYKQSRYIANTAGVGLDAAIVKRVVHNKQEGKRDRFTYFWSKYKSIMRYRYTGVKIWVDGELAVNDLISSATIGIGKYSARGMQQMPYAIADDGLFDMTTIRRLRRWSIKNIKKLYNGRIYEMDEASHHRGKTIRIESSPEIGLEVDGEPLGYTPMEFEIIPRAINVIVSKKFLDNKI